MTEGRFYYDWKTGRMKDTQSNSQATKNMRILETIINDACYSYEKKIKELEKENERLQNCIHRKRVAVKWLKRDYDKLYQLCLDKGFTEEELTKELDR